jgi:hypothetical protein
VWDPVEIDTDNAASWPDEISHEKRDGAGSGAEIQHAHARRNSAAFTNHPGRLSEYATLVIQSFEFSRSTSERILGTQRASSPCFKELHAAAVLDRPLCAATTMCGRHKVAIDLECLTHHIFALSVVLEWI